MAYITLEEAKRQCRIDFESEDETILDLIEQAEAEIVLMTCRSREELLEMGEGNFPLPLKRAVLIRIAQHYFDPEGTEQYNGSVERLVRPYSNPRIPR